MSLLVLAYPELSNNDYERIQEFRSANDKLNYHLVTPHWTVVFPLPEDWNKEGLITETVKQIEGIEPFEFSIRCATLNKDAFKDIYHAFLVPDEGYSDIVKLHDKLYEDALFPYRALHVDYIPHIGIGNSADPLKCLGMVEHWNKEEFVIEGRVTMLDVAKFENDEVQTIQRVPLSG